MASKMVDVLPSGFKDARRFASPPDWIEFADLIGFI
jgi:hypothetical protein